MINEIYSKKYCCEDPSLIENYDLAIADTTQMWDCHHRAEILSCGRFSVSDLKNFGLYYNRPASELIFLTPSAHCRLHGKNRSIDKWKYSFRGKHHTLETKQKMRECKLGHKVSLETRDKIRKTLTGTIAVWKHRNILQYTKDGIFIKKWESMSEVERELGISHCNIVNCCNGKRKSAGGYIWKYVGGN